MTKVAEKYYKVRNIGVKAVDIEIGDQFTLLDIKEQTWDNGKESLSATVIFKDGNERAINLNKTTVQMLISSFGDEYEDWIDKEIFVAGTKATRLGQSIIWAPVQIKKKNPTRKKEKIDTKDVHVIDGSTLEEI